VEVILGIALQHSIALGEAGEWAGLVAALLAAVAAGCLGWHVTDRLLALRQRPDED
jgi:hypothetical protein